MPPSFGKVSFPLPAANDASEMDMRNIDKTAKCKNPFCQQPRPSPMFLDRFITKIPCFAQRIRLNVALWYWIVFSNICDLLHCNPGGATIERSDVQIVAIGKCLAEF